VDAWRRRRPHPRLKPRRGWIGSGSWWKTYLAGFPAVEQRLASWDYTKPVPAVQALTSFIFGREWLTASFWQDWYGIIPLFIGSLMVSVVALLLAVPFGVGAAIYVNQVASPREQKIIKPCIEFISAFPSVVLGFLRHRGARPGAAPAVPAVVAQLGPGLSPTASDSTS
jgi:phosphate transport system permease protein